MSGGLQASKAARLVPQGFTEEQFGRLSNQVRSAAGHLSDDIRVHGSRADFSKTVTSSTDLDIAVRVPSERFRELVREFFGSPNTGSAKEDSMQYAIRYGRIFRGEAGLRQLGKSLQAEFGLSLVQISIVEIGGPFDNGPWIPLR